MVGNDSKVLYHVFNSSAPDSITKYVGVTVC